MNREKFLLKITEKWPVKALSVAAALIITVFYRTNTLETRSITVPLIVEANGNLMPVSSFQETVKVSLRGEDNSIKSILEKDIEAYIDLSKYKNEGTYRIPVQIRKSGSALGVDPLEISVTPIEMQIMLELKESRNIPIYPVFKGTVAEGFEMTNQSINPAHLNAEGPRSALESQHEFTTETIDLEGRYNDFSILVNIVNSNPLIAIHGNKIIEYSASIRPIQREFDYPGYEYNLWTNENGDTQE